MGVFVLLGIIGAATGSGKDKKVQTTGAVQATEATASTTAQATTTAPATTAAPGTTRTAGVPTTASSSTASGVDYPGKQKADHLAADGSVQLSGYTTTIAGVARTSDALTRKLICADVTIRNRDTKSQRYSTYDFRLQTPGGDVKDATITTNNPLDSGDLIAGGSKTGEVCWDDPRLSGQYVLIWKPDAFRADRGIWLVPL